MISPSAQDPYPQLGGSLGISIRLGILLSPPSPALAAFVAPAKRVPALARDSPDGARAWRGMGTRWEPCGNHAYKDEKYGKILNMDK